MPVYYLGSFDHRVVVLQITRLNSFVCIQNLYEVHFSEIALNMGDNTRDVF